MRHLGSLLVVAALASAPAAARAEEPPPAIRALDTDDAAAREAAEAALRDLAERDALVEAALRDGAAFEALGEPAQVALVRLAGELDLGYVNAALRRIVRDEAAADAVRRAAVVALGARGGVADVAAIAGVLDSYPDEAARALATIGGRSAEAALQRHDGPDADPAIRAALVRLGHDEPFDALVAALRTDDTARRERVAGLLSWATGRELPAETAAWETYRRRRDLAAQIAHEDLERAQMAAQELGPVLASRTSSTLRPDLVAILGDER